jgi:hypothetical protein
MRSGLRCSRRTGQLEVYPDLAEDVGAQRRDWANNILSVLSYYRSWLSIQIERARIRSSILILNEFISFSNIMFLVPLDV